MTYYLKIEALAQGDVDVVLALSWRALRHGIQMDSLAGSSYEKSQSQMLLFGWVGTRVC